jgi:hypothetical protein
MPLACIRGEVITILEDAAITYGEDSGGVPCRAKMMSHGDAGATEHSGRQSGQDHIFVFRVNLAEDFI